MSATAHAAHGEPSRPACTQARYEVSRSELPICCPQPGMVLWDAHPRVFLSLDENGEAQCPYCGAVYALKD
ncbi:zinc-finger domain-containing protein [Endothiovibrio diazotrophicus]